ISPVSESILISLFSVMCKNTNHSGKYLVHPKSILFQDQELKIIIAHLHIAARLDFITAKGEVHLMNTPFYCSFHIGTQKRINFGGFKLSKSPCDQKFVVGFHRIK